MKKKIGWSIFALILIVCTCLYAVIDKNNSIYDREIDSSDYISVELGEGDTLTQSFVSAEDFLDGINIKMSVTGEPEGKEVSYKLKDSEGKEVVSGKMLLEDLESGKYFTLKFDRLSGCKDQEYILEFTVSQSADGGMVIVYDVPEAQEGTAFSLKGEKIDGTLALRTITHRFDVETFIVTGIFLIYVFFFVRWLTKVFK